MPMSESTFPAARIVKMSPRRQWKRISGATRESEHVMTVANGCWPSLASERIRSWVVSGVLASGMERLCPARRRSRASSVVMIVPLNLSFVKCHWHLTDNEPAGR